MEVNLWQYYNSTKPGQVQVLGADVLDGTVAQLNGFKSAAGVTYPLLRDCYINQTNPECFWRYYGDRDHFVVINKQGIVRHNAALVWPYGNGYHLNEIRACVDSLVSETAGVDDAPPPAFALAASPNPARGAMTLSFSSPRHLDAARCAVLDLSGRRVATLWDGPLAAGRREWLWDGRDDAGSPVPPGVYLALAEAGTTRLTRRLVVVR